MKSSRVEMAGAIAIVLAWLGPLGCGGDESSGEADELPGGGAGGGSGTSGEAGDADPPSDGVSTEDCTPLPNTTAEVVELVTGPDCRVICEPGWANCDGRQDNGCETSTSDPEACGRCVDACFTDLCGAEPQCTAYQAELWTLQGPFAGTSVEDLALTPNGDIYLRFNGGLLDTGNDPLEAIAAGSVLSLSADGPRWQSLPGSDSLGDGRMVTTPDGVYLVESFGGALIDGQGFGEGGFEIMISFFNFEGERIWNRSMGDTATSPLVGLHADEDSNVFVVLSVREAFEFEGQMVEGATFSEHWVFAFDSTGEFLWLGEHSPLSNRAVLNGFLVTNDFRRSFPALTTGQPDEDALPDIPFGGAQVVERDPDGNIILAGRIISSSRRQAGGYPGYAGVRTWDGEEGLNSQAVIVSKYSPTGEEAWRTAFSHLGGSELIDARSGPDGTIYVLVATGARVTGTPLGDAPEPVYVAQIAPDGQQQGAFRVDLQASRQLGLSVDDEGVVHLGATFDGTAILDDTLEGNGVVGADIRFDPY